MKRLQTKNKVTGQVNVHLSWDKQNLLDIPLQGTHQVTCHHSHQALPPLRGEALGGLKHSQKE